MDAVEPRFLSAPPSHELKPRPSTKRRNVPPLKKPTTPRATTPKAATSKDARLKKISPPSGVLDWKDGKDTSLPKPASTSKMTRKPSSAGRPLVPFSERKSFEDKAASRGRREGETERGSGAPDGASTGREGRQFAVANVGNNGKIYLRPSLRRPAHQRYHPQPNVTFPVTPPSTAGPEAANSERPKPAAKATEHYDSQYTPTSSAIASPTHLSSPKNPTRPTRHRRAMSDSTTREFNSPKEPAAGGYRFVISKPGPGDDTRPRTMEDVDSVGTPMLNINISSWRLGTPRFTLKGTPIIRGSTSALTVEDFRSSSGVSMLNRSNNNLHVLQDLGSRRPSNLGIPQIRFPPTSRAASPQLLRPMRSLYLSTPFAIEPAMFTDLTFKPACDDRSIVRYSTAGAVTAATAPRLVAEITSPSFLDYELISDFFLTFRSFLEPEILLRMLIARLRWALDRCDESGMIVRVRAFVAVRHWILNYFMDDFVLDYGLRVTFCTLLNDFVDELSQNTKSRKVQLKILAELKKCWRRVCAHYWDGPDFDDALGAEVPIAPGGIAGYRDPNLDPAFWEREGLEPPPLANLSRIPSDSAETAGYNADVPKTTNIGDFIVLGNRPRTPQNQLTVNGGLRNGLTSYLSIASEDVVSCSFPGKNMRSLNPNVTQPLAAHPVYSTSPVTQPATTAATPRALVGKRVHPTQTHKRNNSITDSMREHSSDKSSSNGGEFSMTLQSAGSLVRGNLLPPGQPFVDIEPEDYLVDSHRQTTIFQPQGRNPAKEKMLGGGMSGHGMKKLIGSVRRALSTRGQWSSGSQSNLTNISSLAPRDVTANRLPGTAVVPQGGTRRNGARPPVRIDLLGAEVAEDFKKAIREEETAAEAERLGISIPVPNSAPAIPRPLEYSAAHMESSTFDCLPQNQKPRPVSDMGITTGSKSIVIVDDTAQFNMSGLHAGVPTFSPSFEALADSFMLNGGDPTLPTTPPTQTVGGTPRRSSYLLNQHVITSAGSHDPLPPFIPDLATLGGAQSSRPSEDLSRPSFSSMRRSQRYSPISGGSGRRHRTSKPIKTHESPNSVRRHASFSSEIAPDSTSRSFDVTTESSILGKPGAPPPKPPRVLRRRPGGDLRAATNVGELDKPVARKSRSVGSLTTYTESIQSSYLLATHPDRGGHLSTATEEDYAAGRQEGFSVGQLAENPVERDLSFISTHSSKPTMRPSFEQEAKKLAQIPDDEDGSVESALLKLEGKYQPKSKRSFQERQESLVVVSEVISEVASEPIVDVAVYDTESEEVEMENQYLRPHDEHILPSVSGDGRIPASELLDAASGPAREARSFLLSEASRESYCSIPLLDRVLTDNGRSKIAITEWADRSIFRASDGDAGSDELERILLTIPGAEPRHLSYDFVEKTNSIQKIKPGQTAPSGPGEQSFLDDDSVVGSDLSSELSVIDGTGPGNVDDELFSMLAPPTQPPHPPHPPHPSVPTTLAQALGMAPERELYQDQIWGHKPLPLTPDITPMVPYIHEPKFSYEPPGTSEALRPDPQPETSNYRKYSVHLPFILAFDSDILAQQFTLIEKDALNDIDWKELIDMNWQNATSNDARSWVDFLRNTDAHGVEVVIARFNIMVKWAISEIVLTQHIEERARCIIKFIHIAAHCRRYRNFATLAQLTIALSSNEVSRLTKTWELVPAHDLKTLGELETLVTPTRNFYNLRAEMESGSDSGCIPFVGIYTHDLLYNAQRPSEIASSPDTPPLINFERCRIGAAVVKTLLRLLEASTRYAFQPIEGITERCLWMGALTDEEIRRHSESLE